ncbi:hypothetical protein N665_0335s0001 [Sinapis alba]|nr:hypothetical protein N665_0335s0001 [Sinapis alba]
MHPHALLKVSYVNLTCRCSSLEPTCRCGACLSIWSSLSSIFYIDKVRTIL